MKKKEERNKKKQKVKKRNDEPIEDSKLNVRNLVRYFAARKGKSTLWKRSWISHLETFNLAFNSSFIINWNFNEEQKRKTNAS